MEKELYKRFQEYMTVAYEQQKLRNNYSYNQQFSFFMTISDQYRKENFHSDILKVILDPNTVQIGNSNHLKSFLATLGLPQNEFGDDEEIKQYVKVEREEHRVDLLIKYENPNTSEKKAIIVENKINNAVDQDNQLARYYEILSEAGYKVLKIPYITLFGGKIPDYDNWDNIHENTAVIIFDNSNPLFFDLPVKECLKNFLNDCIGAYKNESHSTNEQTLSLLFLSQYQLLLSKLVEDSGMTKEEINNIKKLFEDNKKEELTALLKNWEQRGKCAYEYIVDKCSLDKDIKEDIVHGSKCLVLKKDNEFYEGVYLYPGDTSIQIGFYRKDNNWNDIITKAAERFIKKVCKNCFNIDIYSDWICVYKKWYGLYIEIDKFESFDEINKSFREALKELSKFEPGK